MIARQKFFPHPGERAGSEKRSPPRPCDGVSQSSFSCDNLRLPI